MSRRANESVTEGRSFISHNEKIVKKEKVGIAIKALAISVSILGAAGIATALALHFAVPSETTITSEINPTATSSTASLIKIDNNNVLRKTTNDEQIDVVFTDGALLTGPLLTTKSINEFNNPREFVTKEYVDSIYESNANSASSVVRQSYVDDKFNEALSLNGGQVNGPIRTTRSNLDFEENEFVTVQYVTSKAQEKLSLNGGELLGPLTTNRQNNEFGNTELITKSYVDQEFGKVQTSIEEMISTTTESLIKTSGGTLSAPLKTTRTTFQDDELINKNYADNGIDSSLYERLNYENSSPVLNINSPVYYSPSGFPNTTCTSEGIHSYSWSGWVNNGDIDGTYLTDAEKGLQTPSSVFVNNNNGQSRRGLLNFFGVEYELSKRIEKYPQDVLIAFRLQDVRRGFNRSYDTQFFNLGSLNNTELAKTFTDNNGNTFNYEVTATYDQNTGQFYLKSTFNGVDNCFVSIAGIVLSGKTRSATYELLNSDQTETPFFRTS